MYSKKQQDTQQNHHPKFIRIVSNLQNYIAL